MRRLPDLRRSPILIGGTEITVRMSRITEDIACAADFGRLPVPGDLRSGFCAYFTTSGNVCLQGHFREAVNIEVAPAAKEYTAACREG